MSGHIAKPVKLAGRGRKDKQRPNTGRKAGFEGLLPGTVPARELLPLPISVSGGVGPIDRAVAGGRARKDTPKILTASDRVAGVAEAPPGPTRRAPVTYAKARTGIRDAPDSLFPQLCRAASAGKPGRGTSARQGGLRISERPLRPRSGQDLRHEKISVHQKKL